MSAISQAAAQERVRRALELVEQAQHTLERAAQELCPVIGAAPDWTRISKLAERAHYVWQRLRYEKPRAGYDLDEAARRALGEPPPVPPSSPTR